VDVIGDVDDPGSDVRPMYILCSAYSGKREIVPNSSSPQKSYATLSQLQNLSSG